MQTAPKRSLHPLLAPRSVAVIGVSSRPDSLSYRLLANLVGRGFAGAVYPVNPKADAILSLPAYPSVAAVPGPVDLAIVMVPRDAVLAAVDECLESGVGALVVITAGFREAGAAGADVERQLAGRLRAHGVPMVGPNCMGLINTAAGVSLDATFSPVAARPGRVAFASHSGALGVAVLEAAREVGLAFAQFVSLGNSADVTVCDLLEAWGEDPGVGVVMLYLEAVGEPRRFLAAARRATARVPVIALKSGRTEAGQRAASSHTGALAAEDSAVDALLAQAGVLRAADLTTLYEWVAAFQSQPLPSGGRVAVVTNAGGPAIAAADALARHGLELARLAPETTAALRGMLPAEAAVGNPVDMLPSARPADYRRALELALADTGVDAAVAITVTPILVTPLDIARAQAAVRGHGKPLLSVFMTAPEFYLAVREVDGMPPVYRFPEAAVGALGAMLRHRRRTAREEPATVPPPAAAAVPALADPPRDPDGHVAPDVAFAALEQAGVAVAPCRLADGVEAAAAAAASLGFPVVLKAVAPGLVHKTELGAVVLGLRGADEVRAAATALEHRLAAAGLPSPRFLVQAHLAGGREMIVGAVRRPGFGPLVMCGSGGVAVEVLRDVAFRLAPVTAGDAEEMLDSLAGARLLEPFRGRPAADRRALVRTLCAVADLVAAHPEIAELDLNPLLVLDEGRGCVAVDARIRLASDPG